MKDYNVLVHVLISRTRFYFVFGRIFFANFENIDILPILGKYRSTLMFGKIWIYRISKHRHRQHYSGRKGDREIPGRETYSRLWKRQTLEKRRPTALSLIFPFLWFPPKYFENIFTLVTFEKLRYFGQQFYPLPSSVALLQKTLTFILTVNIDGAN